MPKPAGWRKESYRHSLSSRGIDSTNVKVHVTEKELSRHQTNIVDDIITDGAGFKEIKEFMDKNRSLSSADISYHMRNKLKTMTENIHWLKDNHLVSSEAAGEALNHILILKTSLLEYEFDDVERHLSKNAEQCDRLIHKELVKAFHSRGIPIPLPLQPGFVNMDIKDEKDATKHYRQMSAKLKRTHPAYAEVLEEMSEDESRHARYLQAMKSSKKVDIRTVVTDDSKNIVEELHDRKMLSERQKATLGHLIDREVNKMPPEKLKAKGLAISLVGSLLGPLLGGMLSAGSQSSSNKKGGK